MRSRLTAAGLATGLTLLALAGCSSAGEKSNSLTNGGRAAASAKGGANQDGSGTGRSGLGVTPGTGSAPATSNRVTIGRTRILTADLTVRAKSTGDVGGVADRAITLVQGLGGDVAGDRRTQDGSRTQADVILKVPTTKYGDALNQLAKLGKELQRSAQSVDVTDEVVDVASRVSTQTASVERVRKLLSRANTLGDIVTIEGELAKRQADLEALKARQRALDAQTADATITLHVKAPGATIAKKKEDKQGFLAGLKSGWTAFTASVTVVLTVIGAALPFLVVAAIVLAVVMLALRRRHPDLSPAPTGTE